MENQRMVDPVATIYFRAHKTLTVNQRTIAIDGYFRDIKVANLTLSNSGQGIALGGEMTIDLSQVTTDSRQRDKNLATHLFRCQGDRKFIRIRVLTTDQVSQSTTSWSGRISFDSQCEQGNPIMDGLLLGVELNLTRQNFSGYSRILARTKMPIKIPVSELKLPFADFLSATKNPLIPNMVEVEWGLSFLLVDEASTVPPKVCIVGGGVAGLAAAQTLLEKGISVSLFEKDAILGGKTTSYIDESIGHTVEHGIHGIFPSYVNLDRLLHAAGIGDDIYTQTQTTGVAFAGKMAVTEVAKGKRAMPPFHLFSLIPKGIFRWRDYLSTGRFFLHCVLVGVGRQEHSDQTTFQDILRRSGVSQRMIRHLLVPYVKNLSYARGVEVSAHTAMTALNYYVLERPADVNAKWLKAGPSQLIFQPWMRELSMQGVRFYMSSGVKKILFDSSGKFSGVALAKVIKESELGDKDKVWVEPVGDQPIGFSWHAQTKRLSAFSGKCTHVGCPVKAGMRAGAVGFQCDCHGGFFSASGEVLAGPPPTPLPAMPLHQAKINGENLWMLADTGIIDSPLHTADFAILAMDLHSIQTLLSGREKRIPSLQGLNLLRTTSVLVLRLWFNQQSPTCPDSGVFDADCLLDNFFYLNRFQEEFTGLSEAVLECHIGDGESVSDLADAELYDVVCTELGRYFPQFGRTALIESKCRVARHKNVFTLFAPGDLDKTPAVADKDRPGLLLAGDWVRTKSSSWFLERAAVTGMEAANHVLAAANLEQRTIWQRPAPSLLYHLAAWPFLLWQKAKSQLRAALNLD